MKISSFSYLREYIVERNSNLASPDCCRTNDRALRVSRSQKGERSAAAILHALVASGRIVLMPWGASQRYDFVIDSGAGSFIRVQCKSGVYRHGCVYFRTASADRRRPNGDPYIGQVDALAVYCPDLDASFLVPIDDISARQVAALRVARPLSGQITGIRWARTYLLRGSLPQQRE